MKRMLAILVAAVFMICLDACGKKEGVAAADVTDIWNSVQTTVGENMPMSRDLDATALKSEYGIDSSFLEDYVAKTSSVTARADEFFLAKVKDGKMKDVEAAIQNRLKSLDGNWKEGLQDQYDLIKNSKIVKKGDYIFFTVSAKADELVTVFDKSF